MWFVRGYLTGKIKGAMPPVVTEARPVTVPQSLGGVGAVGGWGGGGIPGLSARRSENNGNSAARHQAYRPTPV